MSLYVTPQDLDLEGLPTAATASVASSRPRICQAVSNEADVYLRARYTLPLAAQVGTVEPVAATGSTGTGVLSVAIPAGVTIGRAYAVKLEVLTTGGSGVATARVSIDGGTTWQSTFTISSGNRTVTLSSTESLTLTFDSGTWFDGDIHYIPVNYSALTSQLVAIASWKLLTRRGVDPDSAAYDAIRTAYKDAMQWLKDLRDNKIDPGLTDSTGSVVENSFQFEPADFETGGGLRNWESVMGRAARSSASTFEGDDW